MTQQSKNLIPASSQTMTGMQAAIYEVETYLNDHYSFRRNVLNDKIEIAVTPTGGDTTDDSSEDRLQWEAVTPKIINTIVRRAKMDGIGGDRTPRQNIEEYIYSDAIASYDPVRSYLDHLPVWDGRNHVAALFSRLPGITTEQLSWCATWLRSAVAHWLGLDTLHGNECVPVLIGAQGCGKSTFAVRLLPEVLREYYMDHINFGNKFDADMALTNNLLVNIDEFDRMSQRQQSVLKQTLSKVKVNGRPIFGKAQEDRQRYASFIATTNDEHPLSDPTGSRRYLCLAIRKGLMIDNAAAIDYEQLYAQVVHELRTDAIPYWFGSEEVQRIQHRNIPFLRTDDIETMLTLLYRLPDRSDEGRWITCREVCDTLTSHFPSLQTCNATKIRIGQTLRYLGCQTKRQPKGMVYRLVSLDQQ